MNAAWQPAPARTALSADSVDLWRSELDREGWPTHDLLPEAERKRAERLKSPAGRCRWTASRWALRRALARYLGEDAFDFLLGPQGKPALVANATGLRFNLSHSGDRALIAVAQDREVGVDIERIDPDRNALELARHGLDPVAAAAVRAAPEESRAIAFYRAWVRREAAAKCLGSGLAAPLPLTPVAVSLLDAGPGYAAALAVAGELPPRTRRFALAPG